MPVATKTRRKKGARRPAPVTAGRRRRIPSRWVKLFELIPGYDPIATAGPGDYFDVEAADETVNFFHECLTHIEGALAGKPFVLEPWEQAVVGCIFGWKQADGYRRYREVFLYVPRKNGKTPLAAGIGGVSLFTDHEIGAQNVCAAGDREQAALLYRHLKGMIENEDELAGRAQIYSGIGQRAVYYPDEHSGVKVISAEAGTKHGGNGHLAIIDELHVQPNRDLVDVLETSMASANRKQPLLMHITTADYVHESICNEKYEYACKARDGVIGDRQFLPVIYEALPEEDWKDKKVWAKANPNLGVSVSLEYIQRMCKKAKQVPGFENTFKRLHLNMRTAQQSRWLPMDIWSAGGSDVDPRTWRAEALERLKGKECMAGLDLGSTRDLTALGLLFGDDAAGYDLIPYFWVPAMGVIDKPHQYRTLYEGWISQGFIKTTPGNVCDYAVVRADINKLAELFGIQEMAVDRVFQGAQLCTDLGDDGLKVIAYGQGTLSMTAPCKRFEELVLGCKFRHGNNPVLNWMAANVELYTDTSGGIKPNKAAKDSPLKIDGIVAFVMALGRRMIQPEKKKSVYERGVGV